MTLNSYGNYQVRQARPVDVAEVFFSRRSPFDERHDTGAKDVLLAAIQNVFYISLDGVGAALVLVVPVCPGVAEISMLTTPEIEKDKRGFYEGTRMFLDDVEGSLGLSRLQCQCFADHDVSLKYLQRVGFVVEGTMRRRWNGEQDVVLLARVK